MGNIFQKDDVKRKSEDLKSDLNQSKIPKETGEYREYVNKMQNLRLKIAVVGKAGSGKSSFIDAFRGINDDDEEAAKVLTVEETKVPKAYSHPLFPNITIWELPEIEKVQFERYDVFIMIVTDRFTENDGFLAKEIQRTGKKFYCVRSKIDISIEGEKRNKNFNLEETLETIRNHCEDNLKESAELSERVFLVSSLHAHMYEFPLLREKMAAELPDYKKHMFTLAMQFFSVNNLMNNKIEMKFDIKCLEWEYCFSGAVPVEVFNVARVIGISVVSLLCFWKLLPLLMKCTLWVMSVKYLGIVFVVVSSFVFMYYFRNKLFGNEMEDIRKLQAKFLKWLMTQ